MNRMRRVSILVICVTLALTVLPTSSQAVEYTSARKFGRGLAGMTTCFLEIPGNMVKVSREKGQGYGFTLGFAQGLGMIVVRVLVGAYETVSAPFEIPAGFEPLVEPEFPWSYFEEPAPRSR